MRTLSASRQHQPLVYRLNIGAVKVTVIAESVAPLLRWQELYPDATEQSVSASVFSTDRKLYDVGSGRLVIAIQGFLIESDGTTLMVDTCVGDCKARARVEFNEARFGWLSRLQAAGIRVEDVDRVLSTHLHVDHVGCNTYYADGRWRPTFPNARYLFVNEEFEFWSSELARSPLERTGDYIGDSVLPLFDAGLADMVDSRHVIDSSIRLIPLPGHTPGHVGVCIESNRERAIISGDLFHTALQFENPDWSTRFCVDPEQSRQSRRAFFEAHADTDTLILPAHFPYPCAGFICREGRGYAFRFIGSEKISTVL
ncbi:MBL fold metallo-hydrolase [Burkholderia multivorans]|uniref:MBL fold metallo-hydrolase n=1 Tax=Burkholderia multivorans TaxID=87883 RepID=UPI0018DB98B8|nr:MBL fold metallo-hydrolase [Burkholderia multivorans]MBH9664694.1 MBL fold metallo-hydrolase [Burkholderia multivorans]